MERKIMIGNLAKNKQQNKLKYQFPQLKVREMT